MWYVPPPGATVSRARLNFHLKTSDHWFNHKRDNQSKSPRATGNSCKTKQNKTKDGIASKPFAILSLIAIGFQFKSVFLVFNHEEKTIFDL